jgi:hypothetical protein
VLVPNTNESSAFDLALAAGVELSPRAAPETPSTGVRLLTSEQLAVQLSIPLTWLEQAARRGDKVVVPLTAGTGSTATGFIALTVNGDAGQFLFRKSAEARVENLKFAYTACRFGGFRACWLCETCGSRRGVLLYLDGFHCRTCLKLPFRSQRRSKAGRAADRAMRLNAAMGGTGNILQNPAKATGMRWTRYLRLYAKFDSARTDAIRLLGDELYKPMLAAMIRQNNWQPTDFGERLSRGKQTSAVNTT